MDVSNGVETEPAPAELQSLFERNYTRLVKSLTLVYGVEAAADAVQEAFIVAHRKWRRVRWLDDPAGWVRRVAINRARSARQRRRRRSELISTITPRSHNELNEADLDLLAALDALAEKQRLAVCLHYLAGYSINEIAHALGVAPGTVKSNLSDARSRLRETLEVRDDVS